MANNRTYGNIIADVKDKFGENDAVFGDETDNSIRKWIIQKEWDIYSERKWPFLQKKTTLSTVASTQTYSLGTDYSFGSLASVFNTTNLTSLQMISAEDYDRLLPGSVTTGSPQYYWLDGVGDVTSTLTGTIDPAASATVTGVGTLFLTELVVGDQITVTGETRTVTAIASNTSLTVDTAFSNNANDTSPDKVTKNVQQVSFWPIPDAVYTISYRYHRDPTPTDITTDQTKDAYAPILPQRYRALLVDAVLEELLQKDTNSTADRVNVKYQNLLARMVSDYAQTPALSHARRSIDSEYYSDLPRLPITYPDN